jgi:lipopolysaccharide biosynthesis protein
VLTLCEAGVEVLLVVNTDLAPAAIEIPATIGPRLYGCMIRQNIGFDFAAWAHGYALIDPGAVRRRLYLINDSIVGPIDDEAYRLLLKRIRGSSADFLGLTCNPDSHEHLQSFFLVFNERLLHSKCFDGFMRNVVNMPSKQTVVDTYEIWLTPFFVRQGFNGEAMFPNLSRDPAPRRDETLYNWRQLVAAGFPFVKAKVLTESPDAEEARWLLPQRYVPRQDRR